jgi:hypothetical protein
MMPKKAVLETPEEQSERFRREAERLIEAGLIDPGKGDEALDKLVRKAGPKGIS